MEDQVMRHAMKLKKKIVKAYCLGAGTDMEALLLEEGAIRRRPDGTYELFSQEAKNGFGEIAQPGDYFKVDDVEGKHYPYPNDKKFFEENHIHLEGDVYEQKNKPLAFWQVTDPMCEEIEYLVQNGKLTLKPEDPSRYFNAFLWGAELSAAMDGAVIFYHVDRDETGAITDIGFNFITAKDFEASYVVCDTE